MFLKSSYKLYSPSKNWFPNQIIIYIVRYSLKVWRSFCVLSQLIPFVDIWEKILFYTEFFGREIKQNNCKKHFFKPLQWKWIPSSALQWSQILITNFRDSQKIPDYITFACTFLSHFFLKLCNFCNLKSRKIDLKIESFYITLISFVSFPSGQLLLFILLNICTLEYSQESR